MNCHRTISMFFLACTPLLAARFINVDPARENHSPYLYVANQPLMAIDPDGKNAKVVIDEKQKTITVSAKIVVWGESADDKTAKMMEKNINDAWKGHTYEDKANKKIYNVVFAVTVTYQKNRPADYEKQAKNDSELNFIELPKGHKRSFVYKNPGYTGQWRGNDQITASWGDPAPHEFGHLIGLKDRYTNGKPDAKWKGNIMAEPAMKGTVEKRNIHTVLEPAYKEHLKNQALAKPKNTTTFELRPKGNLR
ncbi:hypothetical protein [Acanthopleuribacter pedis]|uniref:Peptidase M10 metallopeptidase domain-containing protein n=1 Tax=Acanthopleuribacter pedis TaxID=442870 RepID=A0A8J7U2P5_9BACT|nr:hypothetical protein [Acanthopleuribacter pedis]MBO1317939.1 hypothetical protein [Acanthopleuribacter pedis]